MHETSTESESEYGSSSEDEDDEPPLETRFSKFKEMIREALDFAEEQFEKGGDRFVEKFMLSGEPYRVLLPPSCAAAIAVDGGRMILSTDD